MKTFTTNLMQPCKQTQWGFVIIKTKEILNKDVTLLKCMVKYQTLKITFTISNSNFFFYLQTLISEI